MTNRFTMDEQAFALWGLPWSDEVRFEQLSAHIHPADRDRVRAAFEATRSVTGSFEIDFRIMVDDSVRWVSSRGQGADSNIAEHTMFGIFLDVTGRKQAEEGNELLAGEMSHRVKNLLSLAVGLTNLTYRSAATTQEMLTGLTDRLTALGRAHDLVRPLPGAEGKSVLLGDLFSILLSPYDDKDAFSGRIRIAVTRMGVGEECATTLAMVIHEMATNSVKHGALSCKEGVLNVTSNVDSEFVVLTWAETGGPEIESTPKLTGFGNRMIERSITQRLAGALKYDWQSTGLVATLSLRKDRLAT
ncbi:sensor histidine kinase [Sphingomonas qomolangmaensis]|uniref:histidine kinase n=1 Tax=Sphingomonas qomolangmaensis TaxID=2918765 RepID=A0ABY5LAI4_9SPHN|nr:HWE histidine kinase domain-containing protein [Sphingomonas qomolangmaensis]UUL83772.1 PAS domain-containing protein [Sphingomonas qomolangmaensis]